MNKNCTVQLVCWSTFEQCHKFSVCVCVCYRLVLIKMEVFFILEKSFLLQISFVSGVNAQHTARKSDCFASSSIETTPNHTAIMVLTSLRMHYEVKCLQTMNELNSPNSALMSLASSGLGATSV